MKRSKLFIFIILIALVVLSCNKEEVSPFDDTTISKDTIVISNPIIEFKVKPPHKCDLVDGNKVIVLGDTILWCCKYHLRSSFDDIK